jgi:hypothetical protein
MPSFDLFIKMSEELCGIPAFNLLGTGYAKTYFDTVLSNVGIDSLDRLLDAYNGLPTCCQKDREDAVRADLFSHDEFGPIAQNIMKLWYIATWFAMPPEWREKFKTFPNDKMYLPATYAYPESLLGPAVGAHPAGAKPTGYQSWALPPNYLPFAKAVAPNECSRGK